MLAFHHHSRRLPHRRRPQPPFSIIQQALSSSASNTTIHRRSNTPNPPTIEGTSNPSPPAIDAIDYGINQYVIDQPPRYMNNTHLSSRVGRLNLDWIDPDQSIEKQNKAF
ncbi:hypothetical protein U1Q18_013553 [Sarracenia purpurea var. burkii]